jgi:membrane protein
VITWIRGRLWPVVRATLSRWNANDGTLLATSMAYYAAFSVFPLLLVLISALGFALRYSVGAQNAQEELLRVVADNTAPIVAQQLQGLLSQVESGAGLSGPLGLLTLLIGAIGIFSQLDTAFDRLWRDPAQPSRGLIGGIKYALKNRLKAFLLLMGLGLAVISVFFAGMALTALKTWVAHLPMATWGWEFVQRLTSVALNAMIFSAMYKVLPRGRVRWADAVCGGTIVALVWEIGRLVLSALVVGSSYSAYGVVGSFIALMLWIYYASSLILLGAQIVQVLGNPYDEPNSQSRVQ